jgi:hypothetical protein
MVLRSLPIGAGVAGLALLAAGCGGSKSPSVASIGTTGATTTAAAGTGGTRTALPKGNPSQLLAEWAACMRRHDDPDQADPTIEPNKVIQVTLPAGYAQGAGLGGKDGSNPCTGYLTAASSALAGGAQPAKPDPAKLLKFSRCMRANGIPDFPDPTGNGLSLRRGGDLDPSSPAFQSAQKLCGRKTGLQGPLAGGAPLPGMIRVVVAGAPPPGAGS